jgi:hypothetical protein
MKSPRKADGQGQRYALFWEVLTLDKLMTGSLVHLVYWFGLGVIALAGFGAIGASVGVALREGAVMGWLLALPVFVAGLLVVGALGILWRSFCEFYVVVIQIGEDLRALRVSTEAPAAAAAAPVSETAAADDAEIPSPVPRRTRRAPTV